MFEGLKRARVTVRANLPGWSASGGVGTARADVVAGLSRAHTAAAAT